MGRLKTDMRTRCEFALMGHVVPCDETKEDLVQVTRYLLSAIGVPEDKLDETAEQAVRGIHKYDSEEEKNTVKFITTNKIYGDPIITYLLDTGDDYSPIDFTDPKGLIAKADRECNGAYYWFSYNYNVSIPSFSELGDSFYELSDRGYVHRVG